MSAADPLTDTTGVQVGDPDPWTGDYDMCDARLESAGHLICTAPRGHTGPHVAAGASDIIAVDPGRPSVTDQALAEAWAEGHRTGWEHCQDGNYGNDYWDDPTPNPYAAAARAEMTAEQPCRHCGSCDGPPSCPDCDHADRRAETTTATTEDAVGELLKRMSNAVTRLEALRAQNWDASEGQRLHGKIEGVKLAASYVEEARDLLATARTRPTREQIDRAVGEVLSNASNHPDPVAVLGRSIALLRNKVTDAVLELLQDSTR